MVKNAAGANNAFHHLIQRIETGQAGERVALQDLEIEAAKLVGVSQSCVARF